MKTTQRIKPVDITINEADLSPYIKCIFVAENALIATLSKNQNGEEAKDVLTRFNHHARKLELEDLTTENKESLLLTMQDTLHNLENVLIKNNLQQLQEAKCLVGKLYSYLLLNECCLNEKFVDLLIEPYMKGIEIKEGANEQLARSSLFSKSKEFFEIRVEQAEENTPPPKITQ